MTHRTTITLEADAHEYLLQRGGSNRSALINLLLLKHKEEQLAHRILEANLEESADADYQAELSDWDETLADGLP